MRHRISLAAVCLTCILAANLSGFAEEKEREREPKLERDAAPALTPEAADKTETERITRELQTRISVDFAQTPFDDVVTYLRDKTKLNVVLHPDVEEGEPPVVTLKVVDMRLSNALEWICRVARLKYEVRNDAVFISIDNEAQPLPDPKPEPQGPQPFSGKFRLKLGNGNELETDGEIFTQKTELLDEAVAKFNGAPEKQIYSFAVAAENPLRENLVQLLQNLANGTDVSIDYNTDLQLLVMRGKNTRLLADIADVAATTLKQKKAAGNEKIEKVEKTEKMIEIDPKAKGPKGKDPLF